VVTLGEAEPMTLAVGDVVVYRAHGAGLIAARETRDVDGAPEVVIVLTLSRGLSVHLPLPRARELLRRVVDEAQILLVQAVLQSVPETSGETWLQRRRQAQERLESALGLAEILRDGADREAGQIPRAKLSPSEREFFNRARELLTTEIALSRSVDPAEASLWIDDQLTCAVT
jgi:RNA polymerase-interacting CarD/CdnL/TRCF family regulator